MNVVKLIKLGPDRYEQPLLRLIILNIVGPIPIVGLTAYTIFKMDELAYYRKIKRSSRILFFQRYLSIKFFVNKYFINFNQFGQSGCTQYQPTTQSFVYLNIIRDIYS